MKTITLKPKQSCAVVSDLHIGNGGDSVNQVLPLLDRYDFIVFNGDIFELFIHDWRRLMYDGEAWPLVKWMHENPSRFCFVVGNHDDELWDYEYDIEWPLYDAVRIRQGNKRFLCTHGHLFDKNNRTRPRIWDKMLYRVEWCCNKLFKVNWQDIIFNKRKRFTLIGDYFKDKSVPLQRENAGYYRRAHGADVLIHGHSHFKEVYDRGRIIDAGGFIIGSSYVEIRNGKAALVTM